MEKFLITCLFFFALLPENVFADQPAEKDPFKLESRKAKADSLRDAGKYKDALEVYFDIQKTLDDKGLRIDGRHVKSAENYYQLSYLYLFQSDTLSITYADKAIEYALKTDVDHLIEKCYSLKYYALYEVPGSAPILDELADKCIEYSLKVGNAQMLGEAYMHKCNSLVELGRVDEGDEYCQKAEKIFEQETDESYLAPTLGNIGNVFVKSKNYDKALRYHHKALELETKRGDLRGFVLASGNLADDYFYLKNYERSSYYYKQHVDSLTAEYEQRLDKRFTEANAKYELEKKQKDIAERDLQIAIKDREAAENRVMFNWWITISIIVLVLSVGGYQYYTLRQKKKKILAEQALEQEREFNQLRTNFLENVAHEIRTPITLINGHLQLALDDNETNEQLRHHIEKALTNSQRVLSNSNEILDLLRLEKGALQLVESEIVLLPFLRRVFYSFMSLAEIKKVELIFESNIEPKIAIKTDADRLEKIINNLVSNAIKFSKSNSEVILRANITEGELKISVQDFGIGISPEEQGKVFDRFYQSSYTSSVGGVGVGLSIAQEFAKSLGGGLNVESIQEEGSTFTLKMPVSPFTVEQQLEITELDDSVQAEPQDLRFLEENKPAILIVEDHPEMNDYLTTLLSPNFACESCFDGVEALQKVQTNQYDLIISDIMMPKMDGFEFREKLRSLDQYTTTPFIFITAKVLLEDKVKGFQMGVDDYITKPFEKEELIARVHASLQNKQERERWIKEQLDFVVGEGPDVETQLINQIRQIILANISNEEYKVTDLAEAVNYSQRQLARLLKKAVGMSPVQYILELRLQAAYRVLKGKQFHTLSEVRYEVGISSASYFNKKFKERFGVSPSDVLEKL